MNRQTSIGIIGTGWVGSSVAISVLHQGIANRLMLCDARPGLAEGEAMDLRHGSAFYPAAEIASVEPEGMLQAQAIVIAAGRNSRADQSRLELLRDNAAVVRDLAARLRSYQGIVVMVSNPVDALTALFTEESGMPPQRVIGTGTLLDTARLRQALGRELGLSPHSMHAHVVGEHGDSELVLWSSASVGGIALRQWPQWGHEREARVAEAVRTAAYEIIRRKGATNHAIGLATAALLRAMLREERRVLTVSTLQQGACGVRDVALSLPAIVAGDGIVRVLEPLLDERERLALLKSADVIRNSLAALRVGA